MIYTTYFANLRNLPKNITPISICAKPPVSWTGLEYRALAPSYSCFRELKETGDVSTFTCRYYNETLYPKDARSVVRNLCELAENEDIALVCYEGRDKFCHRHIVAHWLNLAGFEVQEF